MKYRKIGIIGAGVIGKALFDYVDARADLEVAYVLVSDKSKYSGSPMADFIVSDRKEAIKRDADLVLEAATPDLLADMGPAILNKSDLCGFSCSALANASVEKNLRDAALASGRRFFVPHGAVFGLDGLLDGREQIDSVVITTTKSGPSLGLAADAQGVLFEGTARDACGQFPRNVNVHAAVAFMGIGFDRTRSVIVADPNTKAMRHHIAVEGQGLSWDISVSSQSLGGVTGSYTPKSAIGSLKRIIGDEPFLNA